MQTLNSKVENIHELTPMQQGILFHKILDEDSSDDCLQYTFWMNTFINESNFRHALDLLCIRNEVLRTQILYRTTETSKAVVLKERSCDYKEITSVSEETEIEAIRLKELAAGFDLETDPLLRVKRLKFSESRSLFIISLHQIIIDGWSMPLLLKQLLHYYNRLQNNEDFEGLKALLKQEAKTSPSFGDYVELVQMQDRQESLLYFKDLIKDIKSPLGIPPHYPRCKRNDYPVFRIDVDHETSWKLQSLARRLSSSMSQLLECAWGLVLCRYNNETEAVFGKVVSGRNLDLEGIDEIVGIFTNTIPIKISLDGLSSFGDLVISSQKQIRQGQRFHTLPLSEVQESFIEGNQQFETIFIYEDIPSSQDLTANVQTSGHSLSARNLFHPLALVAYTTDQIVLEFSYDTSMYSVNEIERLAKHFYNLLSQLGNAEPTVLLKQLHLMDREEWDLTLNTFNRTDHFPISERTITEAFEEKAKASPHKGALAFGSQHLTYGELNRKANRLADTLLKQGLAKASKVAVICYRGMEFFVGILAVLKAGFVYIPIDPDLPQSKKDFIFSDSETQLVLKTGNAFPDEYGDLKVIDVLKEGAYSAVETNPQCEIHPTDLCYVIYTSSRTGKLSGVMVDHRSVVNLILNFTTKKLIGPSDRILGVSSFALDVSVLEWAGALTSGACLVITDEDSHWDVLKLTDYMKTHQVTFAMMLPELALVGDMGFVETLCTVGSVPTRSVVEKYNLNTYISAYGQTEATILSHIWLHDDGSMVPNVVPIGKPLAHVKSYVLDWEMRPCAVGCIGELYIGGIGVSRGYLNRPQLNTTCFVPNPYGDGKLYRTGDLVYMTPDGNVAYLGSSGGQVMVRGQRVSLEEIETLMRKVPGIEDCACNLVKDEIGDGSIYGYYISQKTYPDRVIRQHLSKDLEEHLIPTAFNRVDTLPYTAKGKLDRDRLPPIRQESQRVILEPETASEKLVAQAIKDILDVGEVGVGDNFFELWDHPIKAARLLNRLNEESQANLDLESILLTPTVGAIAKKLTTKEDDTFPYPHLTKVPRRSSYPMGSTEKRIFIEQLFDEGGKLYNTPFALTSSAPLNLNRLEEAFNALIERYEVLRMGFALDETSGGIMTLAPQAAGHVEYVKAEDSRSLDLIAQDFVRPFDLSAPPLMRLKLVEYTGGNSVLMVDFHHIIVDEPSLYFLLEDLLSLYEGADLPALEYDYVDYIAWKETQDMRTKRTFWEGELQELSSPPKLPSDFPRSARRTFAGAYKTAKIDRSLIEGLRQTASSLAVTEMMLFTAAFEILISRYTASEDACVGIPVQSRTHPDTEHMSGLFVSALPLRLHVDSGEPFRTFVQKLKKKCLLIYENQDFPLEELLSISTSERNMDLNPWFNVLITLIKDRTQVAYMDGSPIKIETLSRSSSVNDLSLVISEGDEDYEIFIEYASDLFKEDTLTRLINHFTNLLRAIVKNPRQRLADLIMTDEIETYTLLETFNPKPETPYKAISVGERFESVVSRCPNRIAVETATEQLTYAALNEKVNQLSHNLLKLGVKPHQHVGVLCERSIEQIVGILAVMKIGAVHVALDPSYPKDRLSYMLSDSDSVLVLTTTSLELGIRTLDLRSPNSYATSCYNPPLAADVNDVAYLIYTSGTTGRPKGVMVKHYGIAAAADYLVSIGAITENDRILGFFNVAFDASVLEWSTSLLNGACLIIAPEELRIDPDGLSRYMREKEVTYACLIPQMAALTDLSMISKFSTGGASAIPSLLMKYPESFYTNFYGPTEATIFAVTWNKAPHEPLPAIIPIGKPIPYDQIYILDQSQHLAGIGVPGELCIAGAGIAEGYYNLPELTNEKFVSNPFGEGKLYRTGDLARFQSDGEILFLGRIDEQVKIRGYRVELEEIEHVLLTYESISAAAVVASSDRLLAYYVSEADIQDDALSDYLSETLPDYMVPGSYLRITALPHTGSGKVDKKALPEIPIEQPKDEGIVTPEEQLVLNLFSEVLETDSIGKNTEFYKLGGDSIKAIYLVAKLREAGYDVSIKDFLKARTAGKVAKLIAEKTEEPVDPTTESFKPLELNRLALSPIQRQFFKAGYTYESHFNQSIFLKLDIDYNPNRLKAAFEALINHHDMLRAYFINGEAYIAKQADFELTYLESSDPGAIYQTCQNIQASFRLSEPPLIKAALIHTIDKDHLFICMHHLICDQVSWMILLDELRLVYEQISVTGLAKLPVKTASYDTYVNALKNMDYDGEIPYWTKIADEVKAQKMQVTQKSTLGALKVLNVSFEHALTSNLISLDSATPQEILLSALTQSLSQWNGDSVNIVSLEGHGRQIDIPIERTIGWFTTIFPVVLKDVDDTGERLEKTKSLLSEIPSGGLGYMVLTQVKGHNFDVHPKIAFNYTGISNSGILSNYDSGMDISPMNQLENQISINVAIIGGILSLNVVYDSLSFDQSNINRLLGLFEQSIRRHLQYLTKVSVFSNQESLPQNLDPEHEENTIEYVTKDLVDTELEEILDYYDWE